MTWKIPESTSHGIRKANQVGSQWGEGKEEHGNGGGESVVGGNKRRKVTETKAVKSQNNVKKTNKKPNQESVHGSGSGETSTGF